MFLTICIDEPGFIIPGKPMRVITGRGLHSKYIDETGEHPVYQAVKRFAYDKGLYSAMTILTQV
jgi:hypothetical protein